MNGREATAVAEGLADRGPPCGAGGFSHAALLYRGKDEYLSGVAAFVRGAVAAAAPIHAAVPGNVMRLVREALPAAPPRALLDDMTDLGRNPARIIAAAQSFADDHPGDHVYCLWEPSWRSRSPAELREVARHEALCNVAFSGRAMTVLCLYDAARLGGDQIGHAEQTHPVVICRGHQRASPAYLGPGRFPAGCDDPLPPSPREAQALVFGDRLGPVREFCARHARAAGLGPARAGDLVIAVSEIAANAYGHAAGGGVIRAWCTGGELLCQVDDCGHIADPLAGRRCRAPDAPGGHGLWLVNRVCDLVERRTRAAGTTTRLHMRRNSV